MIKEIQESVADDGYVQGLPVITRQQTAFVHSYANLHNVRRACTAAGVSSGTGRKWLKDEAVAGYLDYYESEAHVEVKLTRKLLTEMLMGAHKRATCSGEEVAAIREMGKMNGLYEPEKVITANVRYTQVEQLESLSDEELLRLSGDSNSSLAPQAL